MQIIQQSARRADDKIKKREKIVVYSFTGLHFAGPPLHLVVRTLKCSLHYISVSEAAIPTVYMRLIVKDVLFVLSNGRHWRRDSLGDKIFLLQSSSFARHFFLPLR